MISEIRLIVPQALRIIYNTPYTLTLFFCHLDGPLVVRDMEEKPGMRTLIPGT
jgi:hypothetical protein